jgi:hypothetical protein
VPSNYRVRFAHRRSPRFARRPALPYPSPEVHRTARKYANAVESFSKLTAPDHTDHALCPTVERVRHRARHCDRSDRRRRQSHDRAGACLGGMDCVGLAGLRHQPDRDAPPDGSGTARSYALFTLVGIPNPGGATLFRPPRYLSFGRPRVCPFNPSLIDSSAERETQSRLPWQPSLQQPFAHVFGIRRLPIVKRLKVTLDLGRVKTL